MKNEKDNHIDKRFRNAFKDMEVSPKEGLWSEIVQELSGEELDAVFKETLENETQTPPKRVWTTVEKQLPLNLYLKRNLNRLSKVAAMVLLGMVGVLYFTAPSASNEMEVSSVKVEQPTPSEKLESKEFQELVASGGIEVEILAPAPVPKVVSNKKTAEPELAMDNTIVESIKSVELPEEFPFEVDEDKMRAILAPVSALPIESAVVRIQKEEKNMVSEENGTIIPLEIENIVPLTEEEELY